MTLTGTNTEPVQNANRPEFYYSIKMMSGDQVVPVFVTYEALREFASPPDDSLKRLREYRNQIEEIASLKHSAGQIEIEGIVRVTKADVQARKARS